MKKMIAALAVVLLCAGAFGGCQSDPVSDDLVNYINNNLHTMIEANSDVAQKYVDATTAKDVTDASIAAALKDTVIPASDALLTQAKAVVPLTPEVKAVNDEFIAAVEARGTFFKSMLTAVQNGDETLINSTSETLSGVTAQFTKFQTDLTALKKAHNVVDADKT